MDGHTIIFQIEIFVSLTSLLNSGVRLRDFYFDIFGKLCATQMSEGIACLMTHLGTVH